MTQQPEHDRNRKHGEVHSNPYSFGLTEKRQPYLETGYKLWAARQLCRMPKSHIPSHSLDIYQIMDNDQFLPDLSGWPMQGYGDQQPSSFEYGSAETHPLSMQDTGILCDDLNGNPLDGAGLPESLIPEFDLFTQSYIPAQTNSRDTEPSYHRVSQSYLNDYNQIPSFGTPPTTDILAQQSFSNRGPILSSNPTSPFENNNCLVPSGLFDLAVEGSSQFMHSSPFAWPELTDPAFDVSLLDGTVFSNINGNSGDVSYRSDPFSTAPNTYARMDIDTWPELEQTKTTNNPYREMSIRTIDRDMGQFLGPSDPPFPGNDILPDLKGQSPMLLDDAHAQIVHSVSRRAGKRRMGHLSAKAKGSLTFSVAAPTISKPKRAKFPPKRRQEVAEIRQKGACLRCRVLKMRVSLCSYSVDYIQY